MRRNITSHASPGVPSEVPSMFSVSEIHNQFDLDRDSDGKGGTLNASLSAPGKLAYVLVFRGQHKDWPPQILCKSNLHLLPKLHSTPTSSQQADNHNDSDDDPAPAPLYPIFTQSDISSHFMFSGYHTITYISYLEPYSEELVTCLKAKFQGPDGTEKARFTEAWQQSLSMQWAVVDFKLVSEEVVKERGMGNPMIPLKRGTGKSVKEALEEMRSKGPSRKEAAKDTLSFNIGPQDNLG